MDIYMLNKKMLYGIIFLLLLNVVSLFLNVDFYFLSVLNLCFISVLYALNKVEKRMMYLFFLIAFFTYLIAGHFCYEYFGMDIAYYFGDDYYRHSNVCIIIALISLFFGHIIAEKTSDIKGIKYKKDKEEITPKINYNVYIRSASKYLYYLTYVFWLLYGYYEASVSIGGNYLSRYTTVAAPFIVRAISAFTPYFFYIFLATMPPKKEANKSIVLYLIYAVISILSGRRRYFVNMILFVILYYILRNMRADEKEKWIERKHKIFVIILIPTVMIVSFLWDFARFGSSYSGDGGIINLLFGFFQQQGFSSSVIRLEKYYEDTINKDAYYSFYTTVKSFRMNTIVKLLFNPQYDFSYIGHSADLATKGNSLDNALSYIVLWRYMQGNGVGSCYIAELYHDFGKIGICVGSFIYGWIIQKIQKIWIDLKKYNVWLVAIGFAMVDALLRAPRWNFDLIFSYIIDFGMWSSFACVFILSVMLQNKYSKPKRIQKTEGIINR